MRYAILFTLLVSWFGLAALAGSWIVRPGPPRDCGCGCAGDCSRCGCLDAAMRGQLERFKADRAARKGSAR